MESQPASERPHITWPPPNPNGVVVREARAEDNDALLRLELESPLMLGAERVVFDRSPDFFVRHRLQPEHQVVVAELDGRIVGVAAAALHTAVIRGERHRLTYIHHARVHHDAQRKGVAGAFSRALIEWGRDRGSEAPYWYIAPTNERSIAFGGRGGGRWPVDAVFRNFDVSRAEAPVATPLDPGRLSEFVDLVNRTHSGQEMFEPLTLTSLERRLTQDPAQYGRSHLRGVVRAGRLAAAAGLWDEGACMEEIWLPSETGEEERSRAMAVLDWGWVPGEEEAFAALLRSLAGEARRLERHSLTICEPAPGALPDIGLPSDTWSLSLFTPGIDPPPAGETRGIFVDLVYL